MTKFELNLTDEQVRKLKILYDQRNFYDELSKDMKLDIENLKQEILRDEMVLLKCKSEFPTLFNSICCKSFDRASDYRDLNKSIIVQRDKGLVYKSRD